MKALYPLGEQNQQLTLHRFSNQDLDSFVSIAIHDGDDDIKIELSFRFDINSFSIMIRNITGSERSKQQLGVLQQLLETLIPSVISKNLKVNRFEHKMENLIAFFPATQNTKDGIPSNWFFLQLLSSFLRALVSQQDFNFFSFL
jgi:hypothetical protein